MGLVLQVRLPELLASEIRHRAGKGAGVLQQPVVIDQLMAARTPDDVFSALSSFEDA